jgi:endogenous inhibitor of DNA gyrase (YacG/DUF329 family)
MSSKSPANPLIPCPKCGIKQAWDSKNANRPFCSEQCKNKDFIAWANEEQVISGNSLFDDVMSDELPEGMNPDF